MSFCFGISAIVAVDSYCFFTSFVAAYDGITTARVTITISSFRRQNTRKRSLRVTSPFSQSEGPRAGSGAPNNTLRTVKPCRILMAAQPMDGGVARHVVSLVEALPRERFAVDVACPRGSLTWASLEGAAGVELHAIGSHRRPALSDARTLMALLPLVGRADVVHVHSSKAGFLGRLASLPRRKRRACVFTPHGWSFWAADGAEGRLYAGLERVAAGWCGAIVALPEDERAAGLAEGVGRPALDRVIPHGVDLARRSRPRAPGRGRRRGRNRRARAAGGDGRTECERRPGRAGRGARAGALAVGRNGRRRSADRRGRAVPRHDVGTSRGPLRPADGSNEGVAPEQ